MLARFALVQWLGAAQVPAPPQEPFEWAAPPECPERGVVLEAISRRLGRPLTAEEARVEARVVRRARGFTLRLQLQAGGRGETREVVDASCAALADVVAVLVAAAVEPESGLVPGPPLEAEREDEAAVAERAEEEEAEPGSAPGSAQGNGPSAAQAMGPGEARLGEGRGSQPGEALAPGSDGARGGFGRPGGFVRALGGGELGAVPRATGAVGFAGGLLGRRWRVELQGMFVTPQSARRTLSDGAVELRASLWAGALHGCGRLGRGAVEVPLCLGLEAGAMRGEARGWPSGRTAVQGWLAGVLGAGVAWHASARWGLWAAAQVALAPVYPRFELGDAAQAVRLWSPSPASGRLLLGVEVRLADPW